MTPTPRTAPRQVALGYLRAHVTLLVLLHHAVLAYCPYVPPPAPTFAAKPLLWAAFPVVDTQLWPGIEVLVGYNDTFFMALMFLLSGLFVWTSLVRKGASGFLRDRARRLGLPFLVAAAVLAPLAYYPPYRLTGADPGLGAYVDAWLALGTWPAGPAWFLWVLLAFDAGAAALYAVAPHWGSRFGQWLAPRRPMSSFGLLVTLSALAYVPLAWWVDPATWFSAGPFSVQTSRVLHYALYFAVGVGLGAYGTDRGLLAPDGPLARRWLRWLLVAPALFVVQAIAYIMTMSAQLRGEPAPAAQLVVLIGYVLTCAATNLALIALFLRFAQRRSRVGDSLDRNAYGMYVLHYPCVSWLQFGLLGLAWFGAAKGSLVFLLTATLTWTASMALRRLPGTARVL